MRIVRNLLVAALVLPSTASIAGGDIPATPNPAPAKSGTTTPAPGGSKHVIIHSIRTVAGNRAARSAASPQVKVQSGGTAGGKGDTTIQIIIPDKGSGEGGERQRSPAVDAYATSPQGRATFMNMMRNVLGLSSPVQCNEAGANDADGDGQDSMACGGTDCDDNDALRWAGAPEVCDGQGRDEDCDATTIGTRDGDQDGFVDQACRNTGSDGTVYSGDDCDDTKPAIHPIAAEICDRRDNNCDGLVDDGTDRVPLFIDRDGDQFGREEAGERCLNELANHYSLYSTDCDDQNNNVNPGAPEVRDGIDNDCDGAVDEPTTQSSPPRP